MKDFLPRLDAVRFSIALKTCLAIVLGYAIALRLDWKPSFTAIVIVVLQTAALGGSLRKGLMYIAGTMGGAIAAVAMVGLFAHDRRLFILGMAVLTGIGIYRLQGSRFPYAWLIFLVTVALVGWFSAQTAGEAFSIAVMRSSTVCMGSVVVLLVHGILWPIRAGRAFERQLHGFLAGCRDLVSFTSRAVAGAETDVEAAKKTESAQVGTIAALRNSLDAAVGDTQRFKRFHAAYLGLIDQLRELLVAIFAVRDAIASRPDGKADDLPSSLQSVEGRMEGLIGDLALPRDGTVTGRDPERIAGPDIGGLGSSETAFGLMVSGEVQILGSEIEQVRVSLGQVEDPSRLPAPLPPPPRKPFSLASPKFRKAVQGSFVVVLLPTIFILTQWPMGLSLGMVFGTIVVGFGAMFPVAMIRRELLLSLVIGPAIAAPLYFGIMPRIDQYEELIPWLFIAFVPLLYMQTSRNPKTMILAIFSSIFLIALLLLDEERQTYSFSSFLQMWLGFCGGFTVSLTVLALLSPIVPEREFSKQVRSFFAGCGQVMKELGEGAPGAPAGAAIRKTFQERWQGTLRQMHTWSSAIDYRRVAGNDREKTQALVESIERLALRLASAERVRRESVDALDEPLREPLRRVHDACVESFASIADSLADLEPIPKLPIPGKLVRDIEPRGDDPGLSPDAEESDRASVLTYMRAAAHMDSLADKIQTCRVKANALDWGAWHRNYI